MENFDYSVEDLGIVYTGKLENPEKYLPVKAVEVLLAMNDTNGWEWPQYFMRPIKSILRNEDINLWGLNELNE